MVPNYLCWLRWKAPKTEKKVQRKRDTSTNINTRPRYSMCIECLQISSLGKEERKEKETEKVLLWRTNQIVRGNKTLCRPPVVTSQFMEERRSVISGQIIKQKVVQSSADKEVCFRPSICVSLSHLSRFYISLTVFQRELNRQKLLSYLNDMFWALISAGLFKLESIFEMCDA